MKSTHPNIAVLRQFNPANISVSRSILADDVVFHYYNHRLPDMHGDYHGFQGFEELFGKLAAKTNGTFKVRPISITPIGDELIVTHVKDKMMLKGQPIEVDAVVVWRIVDTKIKEVWDIPAVYTTKTE